MSVKWIAAYVVAYMAILIAVAVFLHGGANREPPEYPDPWELQERPDADPYQPVPNWWESGLLSAEPIDLYSAEGRVNPKYWDLLRDKEGWVERIERDSQDEWWWY